MVQVSVQYFLFKILKYWRQSPVLQGRISGDAKRKEKVFSSIRSAPVFLSIYPLLCAIHIFTFSHLHICTRPPLNLLLFIQPALCPGKSSQNPTVLPLPAQKIQSTPTYKQYLETGTCFLWKVKSVQNFWDICATLDEINFGKLESIPKLRQHQKFPDNVCLSSSDIVQTGWSAILSEF